MWYNRKVELQIAADAAAVNTAYYIGTGQNLNSIASTEMSRNGFAASASTSFTVNNPPTSGAYSGNNNALELNVLQQQTPLFCKILGTPVTTIKNRGVASRTTVANNNGCFFALDPCPCGSNIIINGGASINASSCTIISNSTSSSSILLNSGATLNIKNIHTAGDIYNNGATVTSTAPDEINASPVADPLSYLAPPAVGGCDYTSYTVNGGSTGTMNPGVYCNDIILGGDTTMNPGTYILTGGIFNVNAGITLTGNNGYC